MFGSSMATGPIDEDPVPDDSIYALDGRSLREKLLEIVDKIDENVKAAVDCLFHPNTGVERSQRPDEFNENVEKIIGDTKRFNELLNFVVPHQEREEYTRQLRELVDDRDQLICKLAKEMKTVELALIESTFQAQRKLKAIRTAQNKKCNSEKVVRYANLISRSYSVAAPFTWVQGDPSRPFPTQRDFSVSHLIKKNYSSSMGTSAIEMIRGASNAISTGPTNRGPGSSTSTPNATSGQNWASPLTQFQQQQQQRNWTPSPRSGIYGPQQQQSPAPQGRTGRGRPRGSTTASPRNAGPSILQRRTSGNAAGGATASPRLTSPMARMQAQPTAGPISQQPTSRPGYPPVGLPPLQIRPVSRGGAAGVSMSGRPPDNPQISSGSSSSESEDD